MKVFVVFGSTSDETVALPLVGALKEDFDDVEYQVISAHRNIEQLQERIRDWKGDALIAGAGLAAALPGVVAAMTRLPVFGVPVPSQFKGLDSLCSILQMPPGVPVMTCGPQMPEAIVKFLKQRAAARHSPGVHFVAPDAATLARPEVAEMIAKAEALGKEKYIPITASPERKQSVFNVFLVTEPEHIHADSYCLHVPCLSKKDAEDPAAMLRVLEWTNRGGLWLGVNNTRNAVQSVLRLGG